MIDRKLTGLICQIAFRRAALRKKIHQRKFEDEAMHPKYYVEVTEFMLDTNDIVHRDGLPLYRSMVDDCKIDWITGYVNTEVYRDHWISGVIHNMYQDVTTMVEGYDYTNMIVTVRPPLDYKHCLGTWMGRNN